MKTSFQAARTPSAQVTVGSLKPAVTRVQVRHEINVLPSINLELQVVAGQTQDGRTPSVDIDLKRFGVFNRVMQERILNEFGTEPDLRVVLDDGDGHARTFTGFSGNPTFGLQNGGIALGLSGVHEMIALTGFVGSIYTRQVLDSDFYAVVKQNDADNIGLIVQRMLTSLMQRYVGENAVQMMDRDTALDVLPVHRLNTKLMPYADKYLAYSQVGTVFADLGSPESVTQVQPILARLKQLLVRSPNLLAAFDAVRSMFVFQMNASWDGKAWMEQMRTLDNPAGMLIKVPINSVRFNLTGLFRIPIVQLVVQGAGVPFYGITGESGVGSQSGAPARGEASDVFGEMALAGANSVGMIGRYPATVPDNATGRYEFVTAPDWLPAVTPRIIDRKTSGYIGKSRSERALEDVARSVKLTNDRGQVRQGFVDYLAEMEFRNRYLSDATAEVSLPMNLQVQPGYTYYVESMSGEELFSGYLVAVTHDLAIAPDGSAGTATTRLAFSHVRAPSAVIDALREQVVGKDVPSDQQVAILESLP